jgi:hypothetical protein
MFFPFAISIGAGSVRILERPLALFFSLLSFRFHPHFPWKEDGYWNKRHIWDRVFPGFFSKGLGDWSSVNCWERTRQQITSGQDIFYRKSLHSFPHDLP